MESKIKKNIFYNAAKTCLTIIFPIITFPYISRILETENVGRINFSLSVVSYFSLLATLGISTHAIRECSNVKNDKNKLGEVASQIYSLNIITCIISYLLLLICLFTIKPLYDYRVLITIQSLSIIFNVLGTDWLNMAMEDFKYITIRSFLFQVISLIAMFLFVKKRDDYYIYTIITIISLSGASITNILYRKKYCQVRFTFHIDWKKHIRPVILLFVMLLSQNILNNLDITMLGLMKGDYEVGLYTTAYKIINIINQVVASVAWVMMPQLTIAFSKFDYKRINDILYNVLGFTMGVGIPCFVGLNLISEEIILIIGGKSYLEATYCLRILSISLLISFLNGILGNMVFLPSNQERDFMIACLYSMAVNMILNVLLIPTLGNIGASITTVCSALIITFVLLKRMNKEIKFTNVCNTIMAPIIGSLGFVVLGVVLKRVITDYIIRSVIIIGVSVFEYIIVLIIMKNDFAMDMIVPVIKRIKIF